MILDLIDFGRFCSVLVLLDSSDFETTMGWLRAGKWPQQNRYISAAQHSKATKRHFHPHRESGRSSDRSCPGDQFLQRQLLRAPPRSSIKKLLDVNIHKHNNKHTLKLLTFKAQEECFACQIWWLNLDMEHSATRTLHDRETEPLRDKRILICLEAWLSFFQAHFEQKVNQSTWMIQCTCIFGPMASRVFLTHSAIWSQMLSPWRSSRAEFGA